MRSKLIVVLFVILLINGMVFAGGAQDTDSPKPVKEPLVLEIRASQPEYVSRERQIWDVFEEQNPDLKVNLFSINESEEAAYNARIAAGDAPEFAALVYAQTSVQADQLLDLKSVDYKYWDKLAYDAKNAWSSKFGIDKTPVLQWSTGPLASFIYYEDEMAKAGLNPRDIRTLDELDAFLAKVKKVVDSRNDLDYVIATGWHYWCWPYQFLNHFITVFSPDAQDKAAALYTGKISWTDLKENPYVPAFAKLKEWYDMGYFPKEFWNLSWEEDFENSFIAKRAILTYHGPWLWDKVEGANPEAKLSGFPLPANSAGKIQAFPPDVTQGPGIYKSVADDPERLEAAVRAMNFYLGPEGVKMLAESLGSVPAYDLSSVGGADLQSSQYLTVTKAVDEGVFGNVSWDMSNFGCDLGAAYYIDGKPDTKFSDTLQSVWGDYFSGNTDMAEFMAAYQKMFDDAYDIP